MKKEKILSWIVGFVLIAWAQAEGPLWGYLGVLLLINSCFSLSVFSRFYGSKRNKIKKKS